MPSRRLSARLVRTDLISDFAQWAFIVPQNLEMERSYWLRARLVHTDLISGPIGDEPSLSPIGPEMRHRRRQPIGTLHF